MIDITFYLIKWENKEKLHSKHKEGNTRNYRRCSNTNHNFSYLKPVTVGFSISQVFASCSCKLSTKPETVSGCSAADPSELEAKTTI